MGYKAIKIKQVDAFTTIPLEGNAAGVVTNANSLSMQLKQKIAREMNLSETAFVSKSNIADFKVEFFTPKSEVNLCGHATIGTFHTLQEEGRLDSSKNIFYQETKSGILSVEIISKNSETVFIMAQNKPKFKKINNLRKEVVELFELDENDLLETSIMNVNTGLWWIIFGVKSLELLRSIKPDLKAISKLSKENKAVGISIFSLETINKESTYNIRSIAPYVGVEEDPVCGTGNGCVASYIVANNLIQCSDNINLIGEQGNFINKPGKVYIEIQKEKESITEIKVGGSAVTVLEGTLKIDF